MMWDAVSAACVLVGAVFVFSRFRELTDLPTRVLILVIWARFTVQAFPAYTVEMRFAGQSINALVTLASVAVMMIVADKKILRLRRMIPIYLVCGVVALSGVVNFIVMGTIDNVLRWVYMLGVVTLTLRAFLVHGRDRVLRALLTTIIAPVLQLGASIALGVSKAIELDGSVSYIGGFIHEAVFSTILLVFGVLVAFVNWRSRAVQVALIALVFVSIALTNYRTSQISAFPLIATVLVAAALHTLKPRLRVASVVLVAVLIGVTTPVLFNSLPERYEDLGKIAQDIEVLSKKPYEMTKSDRRLLSGRIDLWSIYLYQYSNSSDITKIFGFGPNAWQGRIRLQAHNSFIAYLYEQGILGVTLLIFHFIFFVALIDRKEGVEYMAKLLAAYAGFTIFNLMSNGLWAIEGFIVYGLLIAITLEPALRKAVDRERDGARRELSLFTPAPTQRTVNA